MKLKDLEKIKLIETALMLGIPLGMILVGVNPENTTQAATFIESMANQLPNNFGLYSTLAAIPRLTDSLITTRIEPTTEDYKQIENLYDNIITNLANFLKEQNITDPVEIFTIYQFMYRNGYLSYNHNFNYDMDMKDLSKLNGTDVVRGTGVCRSISSFLTDLYKKMGYDSCNLLVNANRTILNNIDKQGDYPKWKINKKTSRFVKVISKVSTIIPMSNHLITLLEKDEKTYIFDATNDAFLIKGKNNKLILPNQKNGRMKIHYFINCINKLSGQIGSLKSKKQIKDYLQNPTIDYETYKEIYKNTLIYIKNNILLFQEFYENNTSLYLELFEKINEQSDLISRIYPELNLKSIEDFVSLRTEKTTRQK